ncbi:MAG: 30S ribosomal protein S9 [Ignavibacteriales bacterium]|nr:30S ribosomal protein S9 [Ignavibacteriales bacterium]
MARIIKVGRRKEAVARATVKEGSGKVLINGRDIESYFPLETQRSEVLKPFRVTETLGRYDAQIRAVGGGLSGQAGAIKLAIARYLVAMDEDLRGVLRQNNLLTRDPRMVERKKYGQKKARKRFQFSKR